MRQTSITPEDRARRQTDVADVLASLQVEGLEPTDGARRLLDRYAAGELSADDLHTQMLAENAREFGSLPVSRD